MSEQISLFGAGVGEPVTTPIVEGEALAFVLSCIPTIGHAAGTYRAKLQRPLATMYQRDPELAGMWRRVNGTAREPSRQIHKAHGDARWMLDFLHYGARGSGGYENAMTKAPVEAFADRLRPGLLTCGVTITAKKSDADRPARVLLADLEPLVIALCWEPAVAAGCLLAGMGVKPLSGEWMMATDQALAVGQPWSERLAELAARHGPLVRAWRWLYARETSAGNRTGSG